MNKAMIAIIAIALIEVVALFMGHNGVLLISSTNLIAGIAGYSIAKKKSVKPPV